MQLEYLGVMNESLRIKVVNRELKEVDHFKYPDSVLIRCGYFTREIKKSIVLVKEQCNKKISLLGIKPNIKLRKKLVRCYVWSIALYGSDTWTQKNRSGSIWRALKCGAGGE